MVFGNSGIKQKKGMTTNTCHNEMAEAGEVRYKQLLSVKVPKSQRGKATNTREGGVAKPGKAMEYK